MTVFLFQKKSTKSIQNKPCSLCSLQVVYIFLLKSTISPVTGLKNGVEVALYCSTKKKKKNTIPIRCKQGNVYNHIPSEIHTSFQTFSPADSV